VLHKVKKIIIPENKEILFKEIFLNKNNYRFIAGGVSLNWRGNQNEILIDIKEIISKECIVTKEIIKLGAAVGLTDCANFLKTQNFQPPIFNALITALESIASPQIRHMATLGGNIISHFDFSDTLGFLYLLEPNFELLNNSGYKTVSFQELYSPKTKRLTLPEDTLLNAVIFEKSKLTKFDSSLYLKETRVGRDIGIININCLKHNTKNIFDFAIAAYWLQIECFRNITNFNELLKQTENLPAPKADQRATSEYRKKILPYLIEKSIELLEKNG